MKETAYAASSARKGFPTHRQGRIYIFSFFKEMGTTYKKLQQLTVKNA